jgi:formate dehydrogenase subunit gamma
MTDLVRFSVRQRAEHLGVMVLFSALVVTGMPQKYYQASISAKLVHAFGGIEATRLIHRVCGVSFALLVAAHLAVAVWQVLTRRLPRLSIVPGKQDYRDAVQTLRWYLGISRQKARFDRYDYRQKFEYWGMVAGSLIMIGTGFILLFPELVAALLPGQLIPAAQVAHSQEGLMAFLVVIVWHVYNAHLNPDVFPFDRSIFTGRISRHRMLEEHPLELARIEGTSVDEILPPTRASPLAPGPAANAPPAG